MANCAAMLGGDLGSMLLNFAARRDRQHSLSRGVIWRLESGVRNQPLRTASCTVGGRQHVDAAPRGCSEGQGNNSIQL